MTSSYYQGPRLVVVWFSMFALFHSADMVWLLLSGHCEGISTQSPRGCGNYEPDGRVCERQVCPQNAGHKRISTALNGPDTSDDEKNRVAEEELPRTCDTPEQKPDGTVL